MKTTAYILAALFAGLFIASFIIGPFPIPGLFYLLPALFILTTLQLFEKGKIKEGYANVFHNFSTHRTHWYGGTYRNSGAFFTNAQEIQIHGGVFTSHIMHIHEAGSADPPGKDYSLPVSKLVTE